MWKRLTRVHHLGMPISLQPMVVLASYSGEFGGAERLLVEFAQGLGVDCAVACPEGPLSDAASAAGLTVFALRARRLNVRAGIEDRLLAPVRLAGHALELRRLARSLRPELVVAWGMRSAIACTLPARMPCPVAFQHNDLPAGRWIGAAVRAAARRADVVTVPSRAVAAQLDPGGKLASRIRVVSPGVDVERFSVTASPAQPPEVIVLGALVAWKRPDLALEAIAIARRSLPELRLRFVGAALRDDGPSLLDGLRERSREPDLAGAVEFAGAVADPRSALERATCLLHCADAEPFGIAMLEALAAGRPAIVPAAAGPAEIVDERCGRLYAPGDARAAAEAIVGVVADPERATAMGAAGRERARQRFRHTAARAAYADALGLGVSRARRPAVGLALVTVTHNSAAHLRRLLESASRHLPEARIVVVDCASSDETLAVARAHDSVTTIALAQNVGFGVASNRGLEHVTEPVTTLVNPDVELIDDSLLGLAAQLGDMARRDRLLAPLVLSADGSRQDTAHPAPGTLADLLRTVVPPAAVPGTGLAPWGATAPRVVGWAVGCALAGRTDTLRRLGPFDERIFMYGEDLDLGLRAAALGIETWFWPDARVLHHRAHSSRSAFGGEPFEMLARARHEVVRRRLGPRRARLDDAAQALTFASRIVGKRLIGRSALRERHQLGALLNVRRADGSA
jgi:GT2 family glycosyltransferase/glycosyltransferase involved in cell wall biosynthesis